MVLLCLCLSYSVPLKLKLKLRGKIWVISQKKAKLQFVVCDSETLITVEAESLRLLD